jgi:hypothetical protein
MEVGSGREASVIVAEVVDGDVRGYDVQRRVVLAPITIDGARRREAHHRRGSRAHTRSSCEAAANPSRTARWGNEGGRERLRYAGAAYTLAVRLGQGCRTARLESPAHLV